MLYCLRFPVWNATSCFHYIVISILTGSMSDLIVIFSHFPCFLLQFSFPRDVFYSCHLWILDSILVVSFSLFLFTVVCVFCVVVFFVFFCPFAVFPSSLC